MVIKLINTVIISIIAGKVIYAVPVMFAVGLLLRVILKKTPNYEKGSKFNKWCIGISECIVFMMYMKFDYSLSLIKGIAMLAIFLFTSVCDIKTRNLENYVSIMLMLVGLIGVSIPTMFFNSITMLIAFAFMLACAIISKNQIGGADVKFIPVCFFVLGAARGITGLIMGLAFAVIGTLIRNKVKKISDPTEKQTLPLLPYMSAAFMTTYLF